MTLAMKVGGLTFNGFVADYDRVEGFYIDEDGVEGWSDGVEARTERVAKPDGVGYFELPGELESRPISFGGWAVAPSLGALAHMRDDFTALLAGGQTERLVGDELGRQRWTMVQRTTKPQFRPGRRPSNLFKARLQVHWDAPDPRQFGDADPALRALRTGELEALHRGTWFATPTVTVRARSTAPEGYIVQAGEQWFRVGTPITTGQTHVIDMDTGYVRRSGLVVLGAKHSGERIHLPPRSSTPVTVRPQSTGELEYSFVFSPTYI